MELRLLPLPLVFPAALLAWLGLALPLLTVAHASPSPVDSVHFCAFGHEQWRQQHPRAAAKRLADLNVGEPRTLRMIYFLPKDRPFRQDVVDSMRVRIREVQSFYAEQMRAHGYGNTSFRFETDAHGRPQVHRVDGQHPDRHYLDVTHVVFEEIGQVFDLEGNIYLVVVDNSINAIGTGGGSSARGTGGGFKRRGAVLIPGGETLVRGAGSGEPSYGLAAHELGHAFGLQHDFRDGSYIMSYGDRSTLEDSTSSDFAPSWSRLSGYSADFLAVHPYFNHESSLEIDWARLPTAELISPRAYPAGSASVSVRVDVAASQGLHQVFLFGLTRSLGSLETEGCRSFSGEREAVVEFEYDGAVPSSPQNSSLSDPISHPLFVQVVDSEGDAAWADFILAEVSPHQVARLVGPADEVNSVSFSPDGAALVSGSSDGRTILWDVENRGPAATLNSDDGVQSVSFSPDGAILASGSRDGRVILWNAETREQIVSLEGHTDRVQSVSFSPDGAILASGSRDGRIILWSVETRKRIAPLDGHSDEVTSVSFSADGAILASGSMDRTIMLWEVATRARLGTLEGHVAGVTSVSFSPDGATLASGSMDPWDGTVILWDAETREQIATLEGHASGVNSVSFASPGGGTLATGYRDGTVILWDLLTAERVAAFAHTGEILSVSFSPGGGLLAAGGRDGAVLWDTSKWTRRRAFELEILSGDGQQGVPGAALAHPLVVEVRDQYGDPLPDAAVTFTVTAGDGKLSGRFTVERATTDADGRARLTLTLGPRSGQNAVGVSIRGLELATFGAEGVGTAVIDMGRVYRTWHLPEGATARLGKGRVAWGDRAVAHSADGRLLAVATGIGVWLYEATTFRPLALLPSDGEILSVAFSLDGILVAGLASKQIRLWELETGERIGTLSHSESRYGRVTSVVFSPDGTTLASGATDQVITLWDWETQRRTGTWEVEGFTRHLPVAFSPDGTRLVAGFGDHTVRLWDVETRTEVATLRGHTGEVNSVASSPDGSLLASVGGFSGDRGSHDFTVRLWDAATRTEVARLRGHEDLVRSLAFSPDGATLASGSMDRTVRLWDVATRTLRTTLDAYSVRTVSFSPDGATLVYGAQDGVWLQGLETGSAILLPGHEAILYGGSVALSPDGVLLAAAHEGIPVKLWDMRTLEPAGTLSLEGPSPSWVAFSHDGTSLAGGVFSSPRVPMWDVATRQLIGTLEGGQGGGVSAIAQSPVDAFLASGSRGGAVNLWNVETRELIATLKGHTTRITALAFSPDGALLASGGWGGTVILWDVAVQDRIATLAKHHTRVINDVEFSPDGALLATAARDGTVKLWNVARREPITTLEAGGEKSLSFSQDGTILALAHYGQIKLWDVATREVTSTLEYPAGGAGVEFAPDGMLIAGLSDGTVLLWDLQPRPHTVTDVSGHRQEGVAGASLGEPFMVEVRDRNGSPTGRGHCDLCGYRRRGNPLGNDRHNRCRRSGLRHPDLGPPARDQHRRSHC